ncbi:hypothetical protein ACFFSY_24235 [Paenibacillus aurantiacus]|uniref:Uncharacterized protein n=1 Tax=Paenibacillus aurantiacus TaxID=1936118 RepID=A0ABV5KUZ9_9BACL
MLANEESDVSLSNVDIHFNEEVISHEEGIFKKRITDSRKMTAEAEADITIDD